jgi:hypothetical protein
MTQPHNRRASFAVHVEEQEGSWSVYLQRLPIMGLQFHRHGVRPFQDATDATRYADELAETHGGVAVVYH